MLRNIIAISTVAAFALTAPAIADGGDYSSAEETVSQSVIMTGDGFFPEVTYSHPGRSLVFYNESESAIIIKASDESWETDEIPAQTSKTLRLTSEMQKSFFVDGNATVMGAFSFEPAPTHE
ncbi:MAG: hypothetical protein ACRBBT_02260 [Paracoccaceae bacterium]